MPEMSPSGLPQQARSLATYLRRRVHEEGELYVKSRFVAEDVDLSPQQVGSYMPRVAEQTELDIEPWAYTNGTTWRVTEGD